MNCIIFKMPEQLIHKLGMEDAESFMHSYLVTENGNLMVPWYDFIDPKNDEDDLTCAILDDVEYYDANDLMKYGLEEYRSTLKTMVMILLKFHQTRFDQLKERAEA